MPIQSGDVKLLKSAVMADVPEGGGAPTGNAIADGVSNAIFPDISELDRAGGRVNLRKTFVSIQTDDVDTYFGGNVIVADPPEDPNVSVTLFSNGSTFDTRDEATARIESYLNQGPEWAGYLYENHLSGQRVVQLFQRPSADLPNIGQTLVLVQDEGLGTQKLQYVRATAVSAQIRQFFNESTQKEYDANIVTIEISDALRFDFTGSPASYKFTRSSTGTKIRDTVVADAGTYVGVVPLTEAASTGAFTIKGESIFTQLVPSAQTETPITDVRMNGLSNALAPAGGAVTFTLALGFTTTQNMFVGGPFMPGSLTIVRSGITLNDAGGLLLNAGTEVGSVDYDNGIVTLSTNVFGTSSGTHTVTMTPAAVPELVSFQKVIPITVEGRSLSYTFVIDDKPLPRTLSISYLAQGRWYVLRDDGAGVIAGSDAAFGTGTINYTTGSVLVTLGALPDVGSALVVQSFSPVTASTESNTNLANSGKAYIAINTSGELSEEKGARAIAPGQLSVTWNDGTARSVGDDGFGNLTGYATGTVDYANGVVRMSPTTLPAPGTQIILGGSSSIALQTSNVPIVNGYIGDTNIRPGSVSFPMSVRFTYESDIKLEFTALDITVLAYDDAAGNIVFKDPGNGAIVTAGTIDYAQGLINLNSNPTVTLPDRSGPYGKVVALYLSA